MQLNSLLIQITKMYEDYLEEFVFKTAKLIAGKLFGRKSDTNDENAGTDERRPLLPSSTSDDETAEDNQNGTNASEAIFETKAESAREDNQSKPDDIVSTETKIERPLLKEKKTSLNTKSVADDGCNGENTNTSVARCNTYDLLCSQMSEEIAAAEEMQEREANHVVTPEGKRLVSILSKLIQILITFFFVYPKKWRSMPN